MALVVRTAGKHIKVARVAGRQQDLTILKLIGSKLLVVGVIGFKNL